MDSILSKVISARSTDKIIKNRALPLDIAEFKSSCFLTSTYIPDCILLHLTTQFEMKFATVMKDEKLIGHVASSLDPVVRNPLWLSLISFFAAPMQYLTFSFPAERFGRSSYGGA